MTRNKTLLYVALPLFLYGYAFGIGTNFIGEWYYPIKGIGILDFLLVLHFLFLLLMNNKAFAFGVLRKKTVNLAGLIFALATWLLLATLANIVTYGLEARDSLAILRLLYFIVIIIFVSKYVERFGYIHLIIGFLVGTTTIYYQDYSSLSEENSVFFGIPVLSNPNVVGAALGWAVYFCSLGVIAGKKQLFLSLALIISGLSITTFSKGSWLMVILGLTANLLALNMHQRDLMTGQYVKQISVVKYVIFFFAIVGVVFYLYGETIISLVNFKLESTKDIGSLEIRKNLMLAAGYAALDNPLFGLGFGNYYKVKALYPGIVLPFLEREDNAHNVFAQIAATGGIPALILLMVIIIFTWLRLREVLHKQVNGSPHGKSLYLLVSLGIFVLFGSVQLQLLAQPTFWFFSALILGWCHSLNPGWHNRQPK